MRYLALDPGTHKVGLAVAGVEKGSLQPLVRQVVPLSELQAVIERLIKEFQPDQFLIGTGTGSKRLMKQLQSWFPAIRWQVVNEYGTTLQARKRYFAEHPPRGWRRFLPRSLLVPPEPYDDYVALLLIEQVIRR